MKPERLFQAFWFGVLLAYGVYTWATQSNPGFFLGVSFTLAITILLENKQYIRDFKRRQARRGRRAKLKAKRSKSKWEVFHSPRSRS